MPTNGQKKKGINVIRGKYSLSNLMNGGDLGEKTAMQASIRALSYDKHADGNQRRKSLFIHPFSTQHATRHKKAGKQCGLP